MTPSPALPQPAREAGFSIVETLIAVAIVATMSAALFGVVMRDAQARRMLADRRVAIAIAQSRLDQASLSGVAGDLPTNGREEGLDWRIATTPYGGNAREGGPPLREVTVEVFRPGLPRPLVRLQTLRLSQ